MSVEVATDGTAIVSEQQTVPLLSDHQQRENIEETTNLLNPNDQQEVLGLEPACQKAAWRDVKPFMVAWLVVSTVSGLVNAACIVRFFAISYSFLLLSPGLVAAVIGVTCFFCHVCNTGSQRPRFFWAWLAAVLDVIPIVYSGVMLGLSATYVYGSFPEPEHTDDGADDDEYGIASLYVDISAMIFLPTICIAS